MVFDSVDGGLLPEAPAGWGSGGCLPTGGAPDRVWLGCPSAPFPGVEGGQVGQIGAGSGTVRLTAVKRAAGDGEEAFFRHDWLVREWMNCRDRLPACWGVNQQM